MELLAGSRAIDAGDTNFVLSIDARGVSRPLGARGDIGAYEAGVVLGPPRIVTQPVGPQTAREGATIIFSVVATGDPPLLYQWRKDDVDIDGETTPTLTLSFVDDSDEGDYDVVVSNNSGTVTSDPATLTIVHAPEIIDDLFDDSIGFGEQLVLTVTADGDEPLSYTWFTNGVVVLGANLSTFTIDNATNTDAMEYHVIVCNPYGCATSSVANITIGPPSPPAITVQPVDVVALDTDVVVLSVTATGSNPKTIQWYRTVIDSMGLPVGGYMAVTNGTSATLTLPVTAPGNETDREGLYQVIISNGLGSVSSAEVFVDISGYGFGN
jgi:Immunoglobulin I-set domain